MLPKYIKVKTFMSYIDEVIDWEQFDDGIILLSSPNGAGKSSIIDMLTTALFFRARNCDGRGVGMDDLINQNSDSFEIELVFVMNNNEYKVIRRKIRSGAHELELYINNVSHTEKISETQVKILDILKMDYETFMDTVCIGQGNSGSFMEKTPNERKDVFAQVLNLNKYDKLKEYTNELKKEAKQKIEIIENDINRYSELIDLKGNYDTMLNNINTSLKLLRTQCSDKENGLLDLIKEKTEYDNNLKNIEELKKRREDLKQFKVNTLNKREKLLNKIENYKNTINNDVNQKDILSEKIEKYNLDVIDRDILKYQEENDKLNIEISDSKSKIAILESQNSDLQNQTKELKIKYTQLEQYDRADCEFCGNNISESHKKQHLESLKNEGINIISKNKSNKIEIENLISELTKLEENILQIKDEISKLQTLKNKIVQAITNVENLNNNIKNNKILLDETNEEYNENLKIQFEDESEWDEIQFEYKDFNIEKVKKEIEQLKNQRDEERDKQIKIKNKIDEIIHHEKKIKELNLELSDCKLLHSDYEDLEIAWGKSGIQAIIIENTLPEIEIEINDVLELLTDGKVNIEFKTQKDNKGKKSKKPASVETLDIIVNNEFGSRTYETYSGGEKFRIDFACHVGLSKFLAKRAGSTIDLFIIDEGLGSQDQAAKGNIVNSINKLTTMFKKILVITHIEEIQEAFDNKMVITKHPIDGSQIKYVK